jgi:flagellar motor switch protein FliG
MYNPTDIVLTFYGKNENFESVSIGLHSNADNFCETLNELSVAGEKWLQTEIIPENKKIDLQRKYLRISDILSRLDDRGFQKVIGEIGSQEMVKILTLLDEEARKTIYRNVSKSRRELLQDDLSVACITRKEAKEAYKRMVSVINHLADTGEIDFTDGNGRITN